MNENNWYCNQGSPRVKNSIVIEKKKWVVTNEKEELSRDGVKNMNIRNKIRTIWCIFP